MSAPAISQENYEFLQRFVQQEAGIVIDAGKHYLLDSRLGPLLKKHLVTDLNSLCSLLRAASRTPLRREIVEALTTNETMFFRDAAPFDALKNVIVPEFLQERRQTRTLNVWSAAASTGQEIYSIAMLLMEAGLQDWNINLFATDYATHVLDRAREGKYLQIEVNRGLPATYLVKYFSRAGLNWEIRPAIRRLVRFEQMDLRTPKQGLGPFDIVFCRNVLIYFDVPTKKVVLNNIRAAMSPGGWLSLGAAETILNLSAGFERATAGSAVFYRKSV